MPRKGNRTEDRTMKVFETQEEAEQYLHIYITARIDEQDRYETYSDDKKTYYDKHLNIVYDKPEGYQCGAPFWFDDWNLEMFRIYEVENA